MVGLYYIGTYEKRPGDSSNYMNAGDYAAGTYQGDGPTGTLTSDVFIIKGTRITFLIGGGCDRDTEYVELLIDGLGTSKHTGKCSERMDTVYFDVSNYYDRAAQIRIVDASTAIWGHINVDDFRFDWDIEGSVYSGVNQKTTHNGVVESPRSGAAYRFFRHADGSNNWIWFRHSSSYVRPYLLCMTDDNEQLTDALVITKRFRSPTEFSLYIDEQVSAFKITYMDAVINYCNEKEIDIDSIGSLINQKLREKIQMEAELANMIKPRGHLPV
jgi:hypothetical protein